MTHLFANDASWYDAPDFRKAVGEGFTLLTHKAGGDADDPEIASWWKLMSPLRSNTVILGAYWVQYPGNPVGRADAFLSRLDKTCPGWRDGPFALTPDCEIWGGNTATKPPKADIRAFCDRLKSKMPKLHPVPYAAPWAYGNELTGLGYPLWASRYVSGSGTAQSLYPGDGSQLWAPYSGQTPALVQFSSSATVAGQTTCDVSAFRGTVQQLMALVAPGWSTPVTTSVTSISQAAQDAMALTTAIKIHTDLKTPASGLALDQAASEKRIIAGVVAAIAHPASVIDAAALADALDPLLPGVTVTADLVGRALESYNPGPQALAGFEAESLDDVDAHTRQQREEAQRRIQAPNA